MWEDTIVVRGVTTYWTIFSPPKIQWRKPPLHPRAAAHARAVLRTHTRVAGRKGRGEVAEWGLLGVCGGKSPKADPKSERETHFFLQPELCFR